MDSYGIKRNLDDLGRITLPKSFRNDMDLQPGDEVEVCLTDDGIKITKVKGGNDNAKD